MPDSITLEEAGIAAVLRVPEDHDSVIIDKESKEFHSFLGENYEYETNQHKTVHLCSCEKYVPIAIGLSADGKFIGHKPGERNGGIKQDYPTGVECPPLQEVCDEFYDEKCIDGEIWCIWAG